MRRSASATTGFSFQSGDKKVDKTKAANSWAELWDALWQEYWRLVGALTGRPEGEGILTPQGPVPVIYEVESETET